MDPTTPTLSWMEMKVAEEGIKFLYGQAEELTRRWRERRDKAARGEPVDDTEPVEIDLPQAAFAGEMTGASIDLKALDERVETIEQMSSALRRYATGLRPVKLTDDAMVAALDSLRREIEAVYGRRITFRNEPAEVSETRIVGHVRVGEARDADVIGADISGPVNPGTAIEGTADVTKVEGGSVTGTRAKL